ncbi:MAG: MBL fold metallo-hydrolase [Candidatus Eisenbacteria bacterium]|nr:MBL fold metallo-hydrolase [Candidatus Eisenbacteria bacterium]
MKLRFLGTRGYIDPRTRLHRRHSCLQVSYRRTRVLIDWGEDWLGRWKEVPTPRALFITHVHPDHAFGLRDGAPCPVYATPDSWEKLESYPIAERRTLRRRKPVAVGPLSLEAFGVEHSTRAPAVGYRISAGRAAVFYVPDLVYIYQRRAALKGVQIYIGDGATIDRSFVRKRGDTLIGHTPVRTQMTWCRKEGVPRMIVTHCGAQIVGGDERQLKARLRRMAAERGIDVEIARDGMDVTVR